MARIIGMDSLEQKIEKAKEKVVRAKADEIIRAIANSNKSHKEIMQFISST